MRSIGFFLIIFFTTPAWAADFSLPNFLEKKEAYSWQVQKKEEHENYTTHLLRLTSQTWQTTAEVDRPVWEHELRITIPRSLGKTDYALVHVLGGSLGRSLAPSPVLLETALASGTILAELSSVPMQPLLFNGETKARIEDAIIAYSWRKFLDTKEVSWPLHLPMAKAITRAMDSIQEYCQSLKVTKPTKFALLGESKRAWASWLVAASDPRICGLIPISCDFLNVKECFIHHYRSLGTWSVAIRDYLEEGIDASVFELEAFHELMQLEDPYSYRTAYKMPKFLIQASGDPFSPPDSSRHYYSELPSPKYLRYLPNAGHKLPSEEIISSAHAFYLSLIQEKKIPQLTWQRGTDHNLRITTDTTPLKVTLWRASNPNARDFRLDFTEVRWINESLPIAKEHTISPLTPKTGWSAYFVEYTFPTHTFTTEIIITPDTLPFDIKIKN